MAKDLPKNPVLEPIGKNFRFLDTRLIEIYQILVEFYNWLKQCSSPGYLLNFGKTTSKICKKSTKN